MATQVIAQFKILDEADVTHVVSDRRKVIPTTHMGDKNAQPILGKIPNFTTERGYPVSPNEDGTFTVMIGGNVLKATKVE